MLPGMDPRTMKQAMKKLGMKQTEIPAKEVIIKTDHGILSIKEPQVLEVEMMGEHYLQVSGEIEVQEDNEDIETIIAQTGATKTSAKKALEDADGDLAKAILTLQKETHG